MPRASMFSDLTVLTTMAAAAFGAATLLPGGSEVVYVGFLASGYDKPWLLFVVATLANTAGGMTNWIIGRLLAQGADTDRGHRLLERFRLPPDTIRRMHDLFERYAWGALFFCWVPGIGDPIMIVAGMSRYPFWLTVAITCAGRALRYGVVWAATVGAVTAIWG